MEIKQFYIPFDLDILFAGFGQLIDNFGVIINIGIWGFLILTGVYLVIKIGNSFFG